MACHSMEAEALYVSLATFLTLVVIKLLEHLINRVREKQLPFLKTTPIIEAAILKEPECTDSLVEDDANQPCTETLTSPTPQIRPAL